MKNYITELTSEERTQLQQLVKKCNVHDDKIRHAEMLVKADQGNKGPGWPDAQGADVFAAHVTTVERLRKRFIEQGLETALERNKRNNYARKLDGDAEAHLIAIACSAPPAGRSKWSLRLLADRLVEVSVVDSVSYMTVSRTLKKTNLSRG